MANLVIQTCRLNVRSGSDPGQIIDLDSKGILVACGEGALRISEIQPSGKRRMLVPAYVAGKELRVGDFLGVED